MTYRDRRLVWVIEVQRNGRWVPLRWIAYSRRSHGLDQLKVDRACEDDRLRLVPYVPRRPR